MVELQNFLNAPRISSRALFGFNFNPLTLETVLFTCGRGLDSRPFHYNVTDFFFLRNHQHNEPTNEPANKHARSQYIVAEVKI